MSNSVEKRIRYLGSSIFNSLLGQGMTCPSCGDRRASTIDRKWIFTSLRRCEACKLLYRAPTTSEHENERFYQTEYEQGFSTDMPTDGGLASLLASSFAAHEKSYALYISILQALGVAHGAKVFDFGCSWGYGSWQLSQSGYDVDSFEISRPRAEYAKSKLGVSTRSLDDVGIGSYDVFFSSHVIEHVPSVRHMIDLGMRYLKSGGIFVALTPNGSASFRARDSMGWHKSWGLVHPQLIDEEFLSHTFRDSSLLVTGSKRPLEQVREWVNCSGSVIGNLDDGELLFAVRNRNSGPQSAP